MPGITTFGTVTPPAVFLSVEIHKLHKAFKPAANVFAGQPVKLNSSGLITPIVAGTDARDLMIGVVMADVTTASGDEATVIMRGYITQQAISDSSCVIGPVKYTGYDATNLRVMYDAAVVGTDDVYGHTLNAATAAGQILEVVVLP